MCGSEFSNCCFTGFLKGNVRGIKRTDVPLKCGNFQVLGVFFCFILRDLAMTLTQPSCSAHTSLDLLFVWLNPQFDFKQVKALAFCVLQPHKKGSQKGAAPVMGDNCSLVMSLGRPWRVFGGENPKYMP